MFVRRLTVEVDGLERNKRVNRNKVGYILCIYYSLTISISFKDARLFENLAPANYRIA